MSPVLFKSRICQYEDLHEMLRSMLVIKQLRKVG